MNKNMTIHRALAELKLIDSRIEKAINSIDPTGTIQGEKLVNGIYKKDDFEEGAKAKFQSVIDLIERKNKIKSAIVKANGITKVKIGEKEMTIADAINFKSVVIFKKQLIESIESKHNNVKSKVAADNQNIFNVALENSRIMLGRQTDKNATPNDEDVKGIMEPFIKRNEFSLVDPLKCDTLLETLKAEVEEFETGVDAVLSEINAITLIEI